MKFSRSERWLVLIALGFLNWLLIFVIALALLPLEIESQLADHIAYGIVIVAASTTCIWKFLLQSYVPRVREGLIAGCCWTLMALVLDYTARWAVDGATPMAYLTQSAPYLLLILATCAGVGLMLRYFEVRQVASRRREPPVFRKR